MLERHNYALLSLGSRRKNFGVGYRSDERVFFQIFMVVRDNGFRFFQRVKDTTILEL